MKVDVIGSNSLLFANLPPASQVPGRTYRVSNVGPAPGILLTSNGTRYRPAGGLQIIHHVGAPAVTVQSLDTAQEFRSITFPGGLVRQGMTIDIASRAQVGAISSTERNVFYRINGAAIARFGYGANSLDAQFLARMDIQVSSDTSAQHQGGVNGFAGYGGSIAAPQLNPTVDFSQPWTLSFEGMSRAEAAVNISSASWAGGTATVNTSAAHTLAVGDKTVIASVTPSGYNGTFIVATVPTTTQFTVAMAANPGAYTSGGTSSRISNVIIHSTTVRLIG